MHLYKLPSRLWRCQVAKAGIRKSMTFHTKAQAQAWGIEFESEVMAGKRGLSVRKTVRQMLERYMEEETPKKRGAAWEERRIAFFLGEFGPPFVDKLVEDVTPDDIGRWRDYRLKGVKGSSVNRDFNVLAAAFKTAAREWRWLKDSPMPSVRRPPDPSPRSRLIGWREVRKMLRALGWRWTRPETKTQEVAHAFLVALHTGMRAGEVLSATHSGPIAQLSRTKNGDARSVPLSSRAQKLIALCPKYTIDSASLDALFRKARKKAGLEGFTFHDSRATALTRMAKTLDVMTLAKVSGHRDVSMLLNTYYRIKPEDIAKRLR
jgi:integrase